MYGKVLLVSVIVVNCVNKKVDSATQKPFVIFRPGEYFDPFTEQTGKDLKTSASVVTQPNILQGDTKNIFNQHFWHLPLPTAQGYPRTIAQISGNAAQVDAQIRKPNIFHHYGGLNRQPLILNGLAGYGGLQVKQTSDSRKPSSMANSVNVNSQPTNLVERLRRPGSEVAQSSNAVAHPSHHAASKLSGDGHDHKAEHHDSHVDKEVKDYKSNHHKDIKDFENHDDHHKKAHHSEKGGNHKSHHDEAGHYKKHHEAKKSHKAAKFGEKKGHKRGHKTKGYHNKFHRDEYHREHRFYDDYHKEGYHEKHGKSQAKYKKKQGAHKKGGSSKSGHDNKKHGKKHRSEKGKLVDANKGFDKEAGHKKYHKHHRDYHKKQDNAKGKKYGYSTKH